jgi:hypothetical protein
MSWRVILNRWKPAAAIDAAAEICGSEITPREADVADENQRCFFSAASTIALTARQSSTPAIVPSLP